MRFNRQPGESILGGYQFITYLEFERPEEFLKHSAVLSAYITEKRGRPDEETQEALDYFGFEVSGFETRDSYDTFQDYTATRPAKLSVRVSMSVKNPATNPDFYDLLRELDRVMRDLADAIRGTNDETKATADVKAVRVYLDAFRDLISIDEKDHVEHIPAAIPKELDSKLRTTDWSAWSESARKWVEIILRIMEKL